LKTVSPIKNPDYSAKQARQKVFDLTKVSIDAKIYFKSVKKISRARPCHP
jgi:hypothetical protein